MSAVFSVAHLTVLQLSPPDLVRLATLTGYQALGLRLIAVTDTSPGYPLMDDAGAMRETKAAMTDTGVRVLDIEFVRLTSETDVMQFERFLAAGAALGAKYAMASPYDPDLGRLADRLGDFHDLCKRYGLAAVMEFYPWTVVPNPETAIRVVEATKRSDVGILVDTLHFNRSGSKVEQLDALPATRLPYIELSDAQVQRSYTTEELLRAGRVEDARVDAVQFCTFFSGANLAHNRFDPGGKPTRTLLPASRFRRATGCFWQSGWSGSSCWLRTRRDAHATCTRRRARAPARTPSSPRQAPKAARTGKPDVARRLVEAQGATGDSGGSTAKDAAGILFVQRRTMPERP